MSEKTKITEENCPLVPMEDVVLVRKITEEKTAGGILLPENADPSSRALVLGKVVAVGPGRFTEQGIRKPMNVDPGDLVVYGKQAGQENGEEFKKALSDLGFDPNDVDKHLLLAQGNIVAKVKAKKA